jgi:hypothetical protein
MLFLFRQEDTLLQFKSKTVADQSDAVLPEAG